MKYRNVTRSMQSLPGFGLIYPLQYSPEDNSLKQLLIKILDTNGFDIVLDKEELELIGKLAKRNTDATHRDVSEIESYIKVDHVAKARLARDIARNQIAKKKWEEAKKKAEFFEDRKPEEEERKIFAKPLEGSPKSLADILNHNASLN